MAFDLLNFAYTIGTIDGAQDITPGAAQTGFRDFSSISASDTTYVIAVQGAKRAYMKVQKIGSILRPQTYYDGTNGEGASVTFDAGTITVFSDLGWQHIVHVDGDGNAVNAEAVLNSFSPVTLAALKTIPLPSSGQTVVYLREISSGSQDGAFYVWDPDETASGDDFTYVVSSLSATGRWVRQTAIIGVPDLANDAAAYSESIYGVSDDLRHKDSNDIVKKIPRTENYHQGEFITFAQWKALDSGQWAANQTFVFRGVTAENDLAGQRLTFKWDASSTNTDALDVTHLRPDDISGSNAGRAVIVEPAAATKFTDSDTTPSMKGSRIHRCADTAPAAITALDDMVDGEPHYIYPGAADQVFEHGSSLLCPGSTDYTLFTDGSPIIALSDNGVVSLFTGGGSSAGDVVLLSQVFS